MDACVYECLEILDTTMQPGIITAGYMIVRPYDGRTEASLYYLVSADNSAVAKSRDSCTARGSTSTYTRHTAYRTSS